MKKFLSMVLALAMAMSLVTFAAPAAGARDFTDDGSIQYKEAVDVISAIQIMDGYADASFNPSGTLTRGAASKIICNMILGPTTASSLPTNVAPFPDVAAGSTFAGYIAYCSDHGIISGYADGNFRPADSLSGYAFLKMLLCALGYDQEQEGYQGANWRVNVAKQALGIKLNEGLISELDGSRIVTREEAALYAFNTLQADMVEYDARTTVNVNGATITTGNTSFHTRTWNTQSTSRNNIDAGSTTPIAGVAAANIVQFAEEYFPNLRREPTKDRDFQGGQGDFGEPSTKWFWRGVEIGEYNNQVKHTYYGDVKVTDIYKDLNLEGTSHNASVWLNGIHMFNVDIERSNDKKLGEQPASKIVWYDISGDAVPAGSTTAVTSSENGDTLGLAYWTDNSGNKRAVTAAMLNRADGSNMTRTRQETNSLAQTVTNNFIRDVDGSWVRYTTDPATGNLWEATVDGAIRLATDGVTRYRQLWDEKALTGREAFGNKVGDGTIVEVFHDDDSNRTVICAKSTYPGEVTSLHAASNTRDAYVVVDYKGDNWLDYGYTVTDYRNSDNDWNKYETNATFNEDDVVWFTFSEKENKIGEAHIMASVEGQLDRRVNGSNATINGTVYDYGKEIVFDMPETSMTNNSSYIIYRGSEIGNYALFIKEADFAVMQYAFIERISVQDANGQNVSYSGLDSAGKSTYNSGNPSDPNYNGATQSWDGNTVRLLLSDGTVRTVDLDGSNRYRSNDYDIADAYRAGHVVRFAQNSDGTYRLYTLSGSARQARSRFWQTEVTLATLGNAFSISNHQVSNLFLLNGNALTTTAVSTDSETVFVIKDGDNYRVYTGRRNAPDVSYKTNSNNQVVETAQAYAYVSDNLAKVIYIIRGSTTANSNEITFLAGKSRSDLYESDTTENYFEYTAMVGGRVETLLVGTNTTFTVNDTIEQVNGNTTNLIPDNAANNPPYGNSYTIQPTMGDADKAIGSVLINSYETNTDDLVTSGRFESRSLNSYRTLGVKRTSVSDELKVGTYASTANVFTFPGNQNVSIVERTEVLASNCNIYFVDDDGNIARITYNEIRNDADDVVYYTMNDDSEITNIFICDYEP